MCQIFIIFAGDIFQFQLEEFSNNKTFSKKMNKFLCLWITMHAITTAIAYAMLVQNPLRLIVRLAVCPLHGGKTPSYQNAILLFLLYTSLCCPQHIFSSVSHHVGRSLKTEANECSLIHSECQKRS